MTDAPNPATFDIADLFNGKAYPKTSVDVWMDEDAAYQIYKNAQAVRDALQRDEQEKFAELEAKHNELIKRAEPSRVTFNLTGVSRDDRQAALDKVLDTHPMEYNFLGQAKPNPKADEMHANLRWALHTESIVRADGATIVAPTPEQIKFFRGKAPDSALRAIEEAINEFTDGAASGFDTIAQETGFLSQP